MKEPKITVKKDEVNPEPVELIAKSIIEVAQAFEKVKNSKLSRKALIVLLQASIGSAYITQSQIGLVLDHAQALARTYTK